MANVSPGVFTKIIDLSAFIQVVPSTIGFMSGYTRKGRDNELVFVGSRADYINEWGEPNIKDFGKNYGQAPYQAYNYLGESGALYWIRVLPDDAAYSNIRIKSDATASISIDYIDGLNTNAEIETNLVAVGDTKPVCILYPIGRGDFYNAIGIRMTQHSNPTLDGVYVLDIYEKQSDDEDVIIESFDVSFDPDAMDNAGDSIWIVSILENYSSVLRASMTLASGEYTDGYKLVVKVYDKDIGSVSADVDPLLSSLTDNKQDFSDWQNGNPNGKLFKALVKDAKGNEIQGWLGTADPINDYDTVNIYADKSLTIPAWELSTINNVPVVATEWTIGTNYSKGNSVVSRPDPLESLDGLIYEYIYDSTSVATLDTQPGEGANWTSYWKIVFDSNSKLTYVIKESSAILSTPFQGDEPVPLKKGSEGSIRQADGTLDTTELENLLVQAYSGILTNPKTGYAADEILDPEWIYFTLVFDAGYPSDVKTAISTLCQTRRDCVGILDNGDNSTVNKALDERTNTHVFNNFYVALYESYNKVADPFTGEDVWFSPLYHMSYIIPRSDNVAELWFAAAGYNRAAIDSIKAVRYNPRLGQRDQMYLKQLNPIVQFNAGYVVWGQLTSQAKASAMQDLNIVRLVLYCKRAIEQFCRFFIFEQNDPITWGQVATEITEFLETIKQKRGLDSYNVEVSATDYEKKRKTFHVNVTLQPTRVVERIELNFFIK